MKLPEFHIFQRQSGTQHHAKTIARVDMCIGGMAEYPTSSACGQQGGARFKQPGFTGFNFQSGHAQHIAVIVSNQIQCKELIKELCACGNVALVQGVQQRVAGAISRRTGSNGLLTPIVL